MTPARARLPWVAAAGWLLLVGASVWRQAAGSTQPPIYDALSYATKAMNVSTAVGEGRLLNLLSAPPPERPPGTVAMSYPFGFDRTFHGFYFRSVFVPVVLLCLAVWIAGAGTTSADPWTLPLLGTGVASMPILFQFELSDVLPSPVYWGLVDNFMAGISAVAAASIVRGLGRASFVWILVGFVAAAFSLLVKPAGVLTMGLATLAFAIVASLHRRFRLLVGGLVAAALVLGGTLAVAVSSRYLSVQTVAFYRGAGSLLRAQMASSPSPSLVLWMLQASVGLPLLASLLFVLALWLGRGRPPFPCADPLLVPAAVAIATGVLFVVTTDLLQVRYGLPALLMGVVFLVPFVLQVAETSSCRERAVLHGLLAFSPLVLACLLPSSAPPIGLQRLWGVNLSSGGTQEEVRQAERLVEELDRSGRDVKLYSFYSGASTAAFESVGYWRDLVDPAKPNFRVRLPLDWLSPPVFRLKQIVGAEYVLFSPMQNPEARRRTLARRTVVTFADEKALFHALFTELDEASGVRVEWNGAARLLKVTDAATLRKTLAGTLQDYSLRREFSEANPDLASASTRARPAS